MKLKIFLLFIFSVVILNAQSENKSNVELPDFVITGNNKISIKKVDKIKPDFVSSISEDFIRPNYSPEEFETGNFSNPIKGDMSFLNEVSFFKGNISVGAGLYTIPTVDANYAYPFKNGILEGMFSGDYVRSYIDNSDRYNTRLGFNFTYWSDIDGQVLPGTQFNAIGNYGTTSFKFFASDNPAERRSINYGKFDVDIKNDFGKNFLFGFNASNNVAHISQEEFKENNLRLKGEALIKLSAFNVGGVVDYRNHTLKNLLGSNSGKDFLLLRPTVGISFTKLIKGSFGWTFSRGAGETYNALYASVAIKLQKNFTVFGEYNPTSEFTSPGSFLLKNNYLKVDSIGSIYWERSNSFNASIKYEFDKYFQIDAGIKYFSSDKFPYFSQSTSSGKFDLTNTDMKSVNPYSNFLFYLGPLGQFYASIEYAKVTDKDGNNIPYLPEFKLNGIYSYKFANGLMSSLKMDYQSKRFADIQNKNSVGSYIDLGLSFSYTFRSNLDLTIDLNNVLNKKNYLWFGYQEIPLNIILGINYRF